MKNLDLNENNVPVDILSHKDFAPLDEEIIEVQAKDRRKTILTIVGISTTLVFLFFYVGHIFSTATARSNI